MYIYDILHTSYCIMMKVVLIMEFHTFIHIPDSTELSLRQNVLLASGLVSPHLIY